LCLCAGLALAQGLLLPDWRNWFWCGFIIGFPVVAVGYALDSHAHDWSSREAQLGRPKRGFWDLGYRWGFAVFVVVILLMALRAYIAHGRS
jgi:hypothetical protein